MIFILIIITFLNEFFHFKKTGRHHYV
jgi:hypothetical protein